MEEDNQLNNANKAWNETSSSYNQILDLLKDTYQSSSSSTKKKKKRSQVPVPIISVGMK
jgi:tetraacyldisaccharide-1-P 4'-kinase